MLALFLGIPARGGGLLMGWDLCVFVIPWTASLRIPDGSLVLIDVDVLVHAIQF